MAATATLTAVSAATKKQPVRRGFSVACLECGNRDCVQVNLGDVTSFRCEQCENEYTLESVKEVLAQWTAVIAWVEMAPELPE